MTASFSGKISKKKDKEQLEAEERESRENGEGIIIPQWEEGGQLPLCACSLAQGTTKPKPLHTESSLLAAMETAGKELEDEELRAQLKDCGIGTPATRAAIFYYPFLVMGTLVLPKWIARK